MGVEYKNYKLENFFKNIEDRKIVLPDFQRGYVWKTDQQRNLIASVLVGLPIGSTLHIEGKKGDFTARAICEQREIEPKEECEYLLDGQQRVSTLYNAFKNTYKDNWQDVWEKLFKPLRIRWFIKIDLNNDIFGYEKLRFEKDKLFLKEPVEIKDLIVHKEIFKKDKDKWFHPAFDPKDEEGISLTEERKKLEIARLSAKEYLIPLYEIDKGGSGLHKRVLRQLARKRIDELKAYINDGKYTYSEILGHINPDVDTLSKDEIEDLFRDLQISWENDVSRFLEDILRKEIPIILLHKNEIGRAAAIFEEINKGGTPLSNFDLVVAKAARATQNRLGKSLVKVILDILDEEFDVSHIDMEPQNGKWKASYFTPIQENLPSKRFQSLYLNLLSILAYEQKEDRDITKSLISRNSILSLKAEYVVEFTELVTIALSRTFAFLQLKCGHIKESDISYDYMILPIAYLFSKDDIWNNVDKIKKIEAWFWSSLFAGSYKERQDDQFINDLKSLKVWLIEENIAAEELQHWKENEQITLKFLKEKLFRKEDYSNIETLLNLNSNPDIIVPTAMKNSILQYVLSKKPYDLLPNNSQRISAYKSALEDPKLEIHHIIPLSSVTKIGESSKELRKNKRHILNSPLNLTYISDKANAEIRDKRVDEYFSELSSFNINTHFIPDDIHKPQNEEEIKEFLGRRFELIKGSVITHINDLLV